MTAALSAPLVPAEVDLRDFPYLPLDIARLFGSEFHARSSDAVWRAGLTLWLKAYHQVPAGSIPDDDVAMARLAELGRDVKAWRKIKADVLRGWVACSDGRLYHPVVAEKALEAWVEKLVQRKASAAGNAKRYGLAFDPDLYADAMNDTLTRLAALNPNSRILAKRVPKGAAKADGGTPTDLPPGDGSAPAGSADGSDREAGGLPPGGRNAPIGIPPGCDWDVKNLPDGSQGKEREGKGKDTSLRSVGAPAAPDPAPRRAPASFIDPGWAPDLVDRDYAAGQGLDPAEIDREAEKFRDHWLAKGGADGRKADWRAAWRTWCRNAIEFRPRGSPARLGSPGAARPNRPVSGVHSAMAGILAAAERPKEAQ